MAAEVLEKLGFDWQVALANLINFLIIYFLLRKVVFKKLGDSIRERREKIKAGLDDAELAKTKLFEAANEKERVLSEGHQEAKEILLEAESKKEAVIESAKVEAEAEAHKMKEAAIKEIELLKEHQTNQIREKSVNLVIAGVEKILKSEIDSKKAEGMIKEVMKA